MGEIAQHCQRFIDFYANDTQGKVVRENITLAFYAGINQVVDLLKIASEGEEEDDTDADVLQSTHEHLTAYLKIALEGKEGELPTHSFASLYNLFLSLQKSDMKRQRLFYKTAYYAGAKLIIDLLLEAIPEDHPIEDSAPVQRLEMWIEETHLYLKKAYNKGRYISSVDLNKKYH